MAVAAQLIALNVHNLRHDNTNVYILRGLAKCYTDEFRDTATGSILVTIWSAHMLYGLL